MKTSYVLIDFENVHVKSLALLKGDVFRVKVFLGPKNSKLPVELVLAMHELGKSADYIQLGVSGANALDFHITYYLGKLTAEDPTAEFHIISKDTGFDSLIKHLLSKNIQCKRAASIEQMLGVNPAAKPGNQAKAAETRVVEPKIAEPKIAEPKIVDETKPEQQKADQKRPERKRTKPNGTGQKPVQPKTAVPKPKAVPAAKAAPAIAPVVQTVIENLQSRGTARPRTIKTLCSSIKSLRLSLSDEEIAKLVAELESRGKIAISNQQVTYKL